MGDRGIRIPAPDDIPAGGRVLSLRDVGEIRTPPGAFPEGTVFLMRSPQGTAESAFVVSHSIPSGPAPFVGVTFNAALVIPSYGGYYLEARCREEGFPIRLTGSRSALERFGRLQVPVPSLERQQRICDALSAADTCGRAARSVVCHLATFRRALLKGLLTGAVGGESLHPSAVGPIPVGWQVAAFGDVARLTSGKTRPRDTSPVRASSRSVPVYGESGLCGYSANALRQESTIVIGRVGRLCGSVRYVAGASWVTDNALFVYHARPVMDLLFLYYVLCDRDLSRYRNRSRQSVISQADLYPMRFALPPLEEQQRIIGVCRAMERVTEAQEKSSAQLQSLRAALLKRIAGSIGCHVP